MNLKDYVEKRTKAVSSLLSNIEWQRSCKEAKVEPCRRQARKYLLHCGKAYRYEQKRLRKEA